MATVSKVWLKVNGKDTKFDVAYTSGNQTFTVKIPDAMTSETLKSASGKTEAEAIAKAQAAINAYCELKSSKRRVILVYAPKVPPFSRFSYNALNLSVATVNIAYRVLDEVTVDGQKRYVSDNGRAESYTSEEFSVIPWTQSREDFFESAWLTIQDANQRIRTFVRDAQDFPQLIDNAPPLLGNAAPRITARTRSRG